MLEPCLIKTDSLVIIAVIICALGPVSSPPGGKSDNKTYARIIMFSYTTQLQTFLNTYISNAKPIQTKIKLPMSDQPANFTSVSIYPS